MKIAVIGGGGREHALVCKLKESPDCGEVLAIPGNAGIAALARCIPLKASDIAAVVDACVTQQVDYVVVAPDDPLALGMVDALAAKGIAAFGPTAAAARIEASKVFSKTLMRNYGIPTADWESFSSANEALSFLRGRAPERFPVVVKADGLALGKGVLICQTLAKAEAAVRSMMEDGLFGKSGSHVVIEDFLEGPEVSVLAFCDGETLKPMASSMDHKRALDGDEGPNTGGMGVVAPNPAYTPAMAQRCMEEIFMPTLRALQKEGAPFKGCLYFGLMLCKNGPKVIEYNCRFGDPEAQAVLPLLDGDLLSILLACTHGTLAEVSVAQKPGAAACVVLASGGYPGSYKSGLPITGVPQAQALPDVAVYHAGTALDGAGRLCTAGGRVLGVTATGASLPQALEKAYRAAGNVQFEGMHCRHDIGQKALHFLSN